MQIPFANKRNPFIQWTALAICFAVVIGQVIAGWYLSEKKGHRELVALDFGAFYCAGATAGAHRNPYLTASYDACGGNASSTPANALQHRLPAPIPGYDVALFKLLAKLPYMTAVRVWLVVSVAAAIVGVLALALTSGLPAVIVLVTLASTLRESLQLGQLTPILFCSLAIAGYALGKQKYAFAAIAATFAMIEPHVGLPAVTAMFIWAPRCRIVLVIGIAGLVLLSASTLGVATNIDYVRIVLPSHALAEVPTNAQYSLTWLLYVLGMSERNAIVFAELQYGVTICVGLLLARALSRRLQSPALIPLVAAAFSVVGGPFIHITQISFIAILPALVLAGRRNDPLAWIGIGLISVSWNGDTTWLSRPWSPARFECAGILAVTAAYALRERGIPVRSVAAGVALVLYMLVTAAILRYGGAPTRLLDTPAQYARQSASARGYSTWEWGLYQRTLMVNRNREALAAKTPTWLGLIIIIVSVLRNSVVTRAVGTTALMRDAHYL